MQKKILIVGANSYIGNNVEKWLRNSSSEYLINIFDIQHKSIDDISLNTYNSIFYVAGIAHKKESKKNKELYYKINTDLAIKVALKAKNENVEQFIYMSSMSVFGGSKTKIINKNTKEIPNSYYGDSKLKADKQLLELQNEKFNIAIIRPPMIFGYKCKGNFTKLIGLVKKIPIFPNINNKRSMIYIENFCEFIKKIIDNNKFGIFYPQNKEYFSTSEVVLEISKKLNKKIKLTKIFNWLIYIFKNINKNVNKLFDDLYYEKEISNFELDYVIINNKESIEKSLINEKN